MSDIFISYARSTADQAQRVAEALRGLGYGVWRDDEIPANRAYADVIAERLQTAKAVVVIWSAEAAKSEWVRSEAERARAEHKLVQLSVDGARLPMPFDQTQCADLQDWSGEDGPGWKQVVGAIANLAAPNRPGGEAPKKAAPRLSICVLPFSNMSGDPEQEYFSDGISEDIITDLSKVSALGVIARNSAFAFKGKSPNVKEVARELGVSHVLEGSVRKAGNRVRITAQLIDGASGEHAWAERWDRDLDDIFALQDEISQAIVAALKVKLLPAEKRAIENRGTDSVEAYDLILLARNLFRTANPTLQGLETLIRIAEHAIALDPNYALAWVTKARVQSRLLHTFGGAGDGGALAAARALELDPNLAEAHALRARYLDHGGQNDAALAELELALRLDPDSFEVNNVAGTIHYDNRRFDLAARHFEAASKLDDGFEAPFMLMATYVALNDPDKGRAAAAAALPRVEKMLEQDRANGRALGVGVYALAVLGEPGRARDWIARALLLDPENAVMRYNFACSLSRDLSDADGAIELLSAALNNDPVGDNLRSARTDPDFDPIRDDPRFRALIAEAEARQAAKATPPP
ncbi:MAG TPA: TIR domain-containing protein [Caulobacteraceae bacterium]|jgi:adenylate cyclase|nr:TIR domain-containing protein [Caulobacteraceae bacterium]